MNRVDLRKIHYMFVDCESISNEEFNQWLELRSKYLKNIQTQTTLEKEGQP